MIRLQLALLISFCFLIVSISKGQRIKNNSVEKFQTEISFEKFKTNQEIKLKSEQEITSIAIQYKGSIAGSYLLINNLKYTLQYDPHGSNNNEYNISNLVILKEPAHEVDIISGPNTQIIEKAFLLHVPKSSSSLNLKTENGTCELPNLIPQSDWRGDLPAPNFNRRFTDTNHVIVHHSATANNLTDYENVVRNIYIFHTQTRGWSDVGYNYLIAPNGLIYAGRDPGTGEQDLVMGAHFCGRNSNTTGICLLGNLSLVEPTEDALNSLNSLIAWKMDKDQLDPNEFASHPLNTNLPILAGHRDGCATECPGNFTYPMLPSIRQNVISTIDACNEPIPEPVATEFSLGPSPAFYNFLNIKLPDGINPSDMSFFDLNGKEFNIPILNEVNNSFQLDISQIPKGIYIIRIDRPLLKINKKFIRL